MADNAQLIPFVEQPIGADYTAQHALDPNFSLYDPLNFLHSGLHNDFWKAFINNVVKDELQDMLHYIFIELGFDYPYTSNFRSVYTAEEFNDKITKTAVEYDYIPNLKFAEKWAESKTILLDKDYSNDSAALEDRVYQWKIYDFESFPFRRKYYGSYTGAKLAGASIYRHCSVYLMSNYGVVQNSNYLRKFRLIDEGYRSTPTDGWASLWNILSVSGSEKAKYPSTGYVEGLKDFIQFKVPYLKYDDGIMFDYALQNENNETYYPYKYDITKSIEYDKTVFLDLTIDRILKHSSVNYILAPGQVTLCDLEWLEYLELYMERAKRVSDRINIGAQLSMVTDLSGYYAKTDRQYTHMDTHVKVIVIKSSYENNSTPAYIQLGLGGENKSNYFINPTMVKSLVNVYGTSVFGNTLIQDINNTVAATNITDFSGLVVEYPIFESPISEFEIVPFEAGGYKIITPTVYCQEFTDTILSDRQAIKVCPSSLFYPFYHNLSHLTAVDAATLYPTPTTAAANYAADYAKRLTIREPYSTATFAFSTALSADAFFGTVGVDGYAVGNSVTNYSFTDILNKKAGVLGTYTAYNQLASYNEFVDGLTTTIQLPRRFLARGSCKFIFVLSPNLIIPIGEEDESKKRLVHLHRNEIPDDELSTDEYIYAFVTIGPDGSETPIEFDKYKFLEGMSWLFDKTETVDLFYYIDDETNYKSNPLWQYLIIKDMFDQSSKQWSQSAIIYRHKKIDTATGTFYELEEIPTSGLSPLSVDSEGVFSLNTSRYSMSNINQYYGPYINVLPSYNVNSTDPLNIKLEPKTTYIDYKEGIISFIAIANPECLLYDDIYTRYSSHFALNNLPRIETPGVNHGAASSPVYETGKGIFAYNFCTSISDSDFAYFNREQYGMKPSPTAYYAEEIAGLVIDRGTLTPSSILNPIQWTGLHVGNFYLNTTKNFSNLADKKSAVVGITELGVFNSYDQLIAYATFPPIIYNSFNHHLSINLAVLEEGYLPT